HTIFRTLNDARGWARAGAVFEYGTSDCSFTMILSESQYMTQFSNMCSESYSCRVGDDVIINVDRWRNATPSWHEQNGTLASYRQLVINHEVGHRLGHLDNEPSCAGAGQPASLMQQQSMGLRGCKINPWPLEEELWIQ
ncbi:MAG: DUF3152 domain-containing protein, partial [Bifidobacteriaceae bacterium]|nr:DUF3152 domain-containing protein [Bifidobacteriaceae bacterium]